MAKRVTEEDIRIINETYLACGTYSETAKHCGWSASTVKKYIDPSYTSSSKEENSNIEISIPSIEDTIISLTSIEGLSKVSAQERKEIKSLWKEIIA